MASIAAPDSPDQIGTTAFRWWHAVAIALIVALPLLLPPVLPLADLGGHLGRYAIQLDGGRDPQLAQWYTFRWLLIPNLGVDLLVQGLGPLIGLEMAVRLSVFTAAFLQALGILATSRVAHGRITPFAIVALPFVYAHSMLYGFLNYTLSLGLLWCSLALWIAMSERGAIRRRWLVFALIATVIWTCHLVGWALLCIAAGSQELVRQREHKRSLVGAAVASVGPLTCLLTPWVIKLLTFEQATGSGKSSGWFLWSEKVAELFTVFRDKWYWFDIVSVTIVLAVIVWTWVSGWCRANRGLLLAGVITAGCVIVLPQRLLGSFFADQRLVEPALVFALLAGGLSGKGPSGLPRMLYAFAALFAGARLAANTVSLWDFGNRSAEQLEVLDALPRHAQMVDFRALRCPPREQWSLDRWTHLGGYAIARRHAFSNGQWDVPGAQLLHVHNATAGPFQVDNTQIDFEQACEDHIGVVAKAGEVPAAIPYLWVIWSSRDVPLAGWTPISRHRGSVLYRRSANG